MKRTVIKVLSCMIVFFIIGVFNIYAQKTEKEPVRIACVGNSITFGAGLDNRLRDSYPSVLGRMLGEDYLVRNFGVNGCTLLNDGDYPYMKGNAFRDALAFQPNIVIIKLGTNDSKPHNWKHKNNFEKDLETMVKSFRELTSDPDIYLCYPATAYNKDSGINEETISKEVIPMIAAAAKQMKLKIIDLHTPTANMSENFPDKVHPNAKGAVVLASTIYTALTGKEISNVASGQIFPKIDETVRINQLTPKDGKIRMVLDTDTYNEVDDQFALAYALLSKDRVSVEAVYAAPFHNLRSSGPADGMEKSYEEILRLLKLMKKPSDGFAFRGSREFLKDVSKPIRSEAALDLIQKAKKSTPEDPLYVVVIGCITNVASAILIEPEIIKNIVVVWQGAKSLDWPNQREFNLLQDVLSGQVVFNSGVPLVLAPCEPVVTHFYTTLPELKYYLEGKNELCNFLYESVKAYHIEKTKRTNSVDKVWSKVLYDVVVVSWLVNPDWVRMEIVHCPILTDQMTFSMDYSRHFIKMARSISRDDIFNDLFSKLANSTTR